MEHKKHLVIRSWGSVSPLGASAEEIHQRCFSDESFIVKNAHDEWVAPVSDKAEQFIRALSDSDKKYKSVDRSVLLGIQAARNAWENYKQRWVVDPTKKGGINIGSSRGATGLFEEYHQSFRQSATSSVPVLTSPLTTLGNVSSWVARDLNLEVTAFDHSVTCSTALYAIGNAIAWLKSGMADVFLAGGTEAPLTDFTIAQMRALKIYSKRTGDYPCRPLAFDETQKNAMVLGEGAACFVLEYVATEALQKGDVLIEGYGFANETVTSATAISKTGEALQKAMKHALTEHTNDSIDAIILHAPGTYNGDRAEINAIHTVFPNKLPNLVSNKWKVGHLLGASAALSIVQAIQVLENGSYTDFPYATAVEKTDRSIHKIMINSIGFGGNAGSLILSKYE